MTTTFLLDVNVLVALVDPLYVQHDTAHEWFAAQGHHAWATCPSTLACANGGQLASFDKRLVKDAVRGGARGLHLIA